MGAEMSEKPLLDVDVAHAAIEMALEHGDHEEVGNILRELVAAERERWAVWHNSQARDWRNKMAKAVDQREITYANRCDDKAREHEYSTAKLRESGA